MMRYLSFFSSHILTYYNKVTKKYKIKLLKLSYVRLNSSKMKNYIVTLSSHH